MQPLISSTDPIAKTSSRSSVSTASAVDRLLVIVNDLVCELRAGQPTDRTADLDSNLERDLGLDSLERSELLLRVEKAFGVRLPAHTLVTAETSRDLMRLIGRGYASRVEVEPEAQLAMQAALQKHVDNAISQTMSVPAQLEFGRFSCSKPPTSLVERLQDVWSQPGQPENVARGHAGRLRVTHLSSTPEGAAKRGAHPQLSKKRGRSSWIDRKFCLSVLDRGTQRLSHALQTLVQGLTIT